MIKLLSAALVVAGLLLLIVSCAAPPPSEPENSYEVDQLANPANCVLLSGSQSLCEVTLRSGVKCLLFYSVVGVAIDCDWP